MEVMGVFSSCVTALMKLPCCSFRRISRTRKVVFKIIPRIIVANTITPRNNMTLWRQFKMIQPTSSATARATRDIPSTRKNAIVFRRLEMRIGLAESQLIVPRLYLRERQTANLDGRGVIYRQECIVGHSPAIHFT